MFGDIFGPAHLEECLGGQLHIQIAVHFIFVIKLFEVWEPAFDGILQIAGHNFDSVDLTEKTSYCVGAPERTGNYLDMTDLAYLQFLIFIESIIELHALFQIIDFVLAGLRRLFEDFQQWLLQLRAVHSASHLTL